MFKIKNILEKDLEKVSLFIEDNFLNFPPYKDYLNKKELEGFIYLNSPKKLLKKLNNKNYIFTKFVEDDNNNVIWICFAELEDIEINDKKKKMLCIKRMHWHRNFIEQWIYDILYKDIEKFVLERNKNILEKIDYLTVVPSNHFIKDFFLWKDFIEIKKHITDSMIENNIPEVSLLWKNFI